jgi:hypothetical protein
LDDGTWGRELVTWPGHPKFEKGMFVARIPGDAMEPIIPAGGYCLFRKPSGNLPDDDIMLVAHPAINDPHSGEWAVRKASFTGAVGEKDEWKHGQIKLHAENTFVPTRTIDLANMTEIQLLGDLVESLRVFEDDMAETG